MFPPLYAILDAQSSERPILSLAETLAAAGTRLVQLRDKKGTSRKILDLVRVLQKLLDARSVRLIVNDRADLAALAGAGGVHVGQTDLPVEDARRICGADVWVGVSTHNLEQLGEAAKTSADYIAVGPIFPTRTKENPDPVLGLDFIERARALTDKPLVAIGGITIKSAEAVFRAGADSVAVARDLLEASDPGAKVREYLKIAERVEALRS